MAKIARKLQEARSQFNKEEFFALEDAIEMAKKTSYTSFDASIDLNFKLNLDTKKADQQLRGSVALPHGNGKKTVVLVASDESEHRKEAKEAGADIILNKIELEEYLAKDKYDFQVMVIEPKIMPILGKYGKKLGPKGLMPNLKTGTITTQIGKTVQNIKRGRANFRADRGGCVHTQIGKCSMPTEALVENAKVVINTLKHQKPHGVKGIYMQKIYVSASMGPSIKIKID